jgi:DNA-binding CsgD family transcriptional regulator
MQHWQLGYFLVTLSVGLVSLGILSTIYRQNQEKLLRDYLLFSCAFTLFVILNLLSFYASSLAPLNFSVVSILGYFESPIALLLLMLTLTRFFHRLCVVSHAGTRNTVAVGMIIFSYICYQVLSILPYTVTYDDARVTLVAENPAIFVGDLFLYAVLGVAILYCLWIAIASYKHFPENADKRLLKRIAILLGCFVPGIVFDVFELFPITFFPLIYSGFNLAVTARYYGKYAASEPQETISRETSEEPEFTEVSPDEDLFVQYNISPREQELIALLLQGHRYQDIADTLHISLNTVKAHVRNIYPKCGVNSRYELTALLKQAPKGCSSPEES